MILCGSIMLFSQAVLNAQNPQDLSKTDLIPRPVSVKPASGVFELTSATDIYIQGQDASLNQIGQYLADKLKTSTGFAIDVVAGDKTPSAGNIQLALTGNNPDKQLGDEGYTLTITDKLLPGFRPTLLQGIFRGVQTIRQLLPAKIEMASVQKGPWNIPAGTITDYPAYSYRGAMLDVSRHFFQVEDVKRFIDFLAYYKMNHLHLHLSDDQGWRIEIKSWPDLTKIGGSTQVGGGNGGYYTQEQYTDIVNYAKARYITIVPEIDMPGHTNAALASYPELNCDGKATKLYTGTEVGFSSLCTSKEITYKFIDDVVRELAAIDTRTIYSYRRRRIARNKGRGLYPFHQQGSGYCTLSWKESSWLG